MTSFTAPSIPLPSTRFDRVLDMIGNTPLVDVSNLSPNPRVRILAKMAVPQRRTSAPILVIYGGADTYVAPQWTRRAIAESCAMGSKLGAIEEPGKGHLDVDGGAFMGWLTARFDGLPAPQNCDAQQPR